MDLIYNLILFSPFFVSFFWIVLFFINRNKNFRAQNIWSAYLLITCVCTFIWGVYFKGINDYYLYCVLDIFDFTFTLLLSPFVYFYFWSWTSKKKFTWKQYVWLVPCLSIGLISAIIYLLMSKEQAIGYIQNVIEDSENASFPAGSLEWLLHLISIRIYWVVLLFQIVTVMIYSSLNLIRYKRGLSNYFSNLDEKSIENNRVVLTGLFILLAIGLLSTCLLNISYEYYFSLRYFYMIATSIVIYYTSLHIFRIRFTGEYIIPEMEKTDEEPLNRTELNEICVKTLPQLIKLMEEDKIFLQSNLTLDDIARRINSNRTYISRIVNEKFHCNFHEFINRKRIEFAKTLIAQNPIYTQERIAEMSGFTHSSTFSRIFKQYAGITFREFQKQF